MKKIAKTILALGAVTLLAGCSAQKQCDEKTAKERAAKIAAELPKLQLGNDFALESHMVESAESKSGTKVYSGVGETKLNVLYDAENVFFYTYSFNHISETGETEKTLESHQWAYYDGGSFYVASSTTLNGETKSTYSEKEMTKDAASILFASYTASVLITFKSANDPETYLADIDDAIAAMNGSKKSEAEAEGASYSSKLFLGSNDDQSLYFEGSMDTSKSTAAETQTYNVSMHGEQMFEYKQNHFIRSKVVSDMKSETSNGDYTKEYIAIESKAAYSKISRNYPNLSDYIEL